MAPTIGTEPRSLHKSLARQVLVTYLPGHPTLCWPSALGRVGHVQQSDSTLPECVLMSPVPPCIPQVVPRVKELANDSSQFVRAALAGVVMELAPQLGKQPTIEHLVPVFLNLLRDPYPDVRLNVISKLDQVRHCKDV